MSKGWEEHRLESDGRWQATGQLRDASPFATEKKPVETLGVTDTLGKPRQMWLLASPDGTYPPVGALGWAQFSRP